MKIKYQEILGKDGWAKKEGDRKSDFEERSVPFLASMICRGA